MRMDIIAALALVALGQTALAAAHYVDLNTPNPTSPYTNWATAARVIQDAVDAATAGDEVLVTNGLYAVGARPGADYVTNRVSVDKPLTLRSVNGPQLTMIDGRGAAPRLLGTSLEPLQLFLGQRRDAVPGDVHAARGHSKRFGNVLHRPIFQRG